MPIPSSFRALVEHPAPGLHFPAHPGAGTPERILASPHRAGRPAKPKALALLKKLTARCPTARDQLAEFYSTWDGFELCRLSDGDETIPLLSLFSIEEWAEATAELATGDVSFLLEDLEEVLPRDGFLVIGGSPSEGTRLLLSLTGTWDGKSTAGAICYASMDPVMGVGEPIAASFSELLEQIAADPAEFLQKISSTYFVTNGGRTWGDVADRYIPDIGAPGSAADAGDKDWEDPRQGALFG